MTTTKQLCNEKQQTCDFSQKLRRLLNRPTRGDVTIGVFESHCSMVKRVNNYIRSLYALRYTNRLKKITVINLFQVVRTIDTTAIYGCLSGTTVEACLAVWRVWQRWPTDRLADWPVLYLSSTKSTLHDTRCLFSVPTQLSVIRLSVSAEVSSFKMSQLWLSSLPCTLLSAVCRQPDRRNSDTMLGLQSNSSADLLLYW
jgi:hypothetical protein